MRLRQAGAWLLMGVSSVTGQEFDLKDSVVFRDFNGEAVGNRSIAVFFGNGEQQFFFDTVLGITVKSVTLRQGPVGDGGADGKALASGSPEGSSDSSSPATSTQRSVPTSIPPPPKRETRQIESALLQEQSDAASNAIGDLASLKITAISGLSAELVGQQIDIPQDSMNRIFSDARDQILYFDVSWDQGSSKGGRSFSRYIAFASSTASASQLSRDPRLQNQQPAEDERQPDSDANTAGGGDGGNAGDGVNTTPTSSGGTIAATNSLPSSASSSGSASSISTGAIAGIAVGCAIVALLIIGALVWFLLRRRKRNSLDHDGAIGYGNGRPSHRRTADLMAEKEATAGVGETPHSPYSEDGGVHGAAPAGTEPLHSEVERDRDRDREFSPYTDAAPVPLGSRAVDGPGVADAELNMSGAGPGATAARSGAASQMSGRYAHLIEEGMTPAEIARMEEEERHLDAAIERAGASGH